MSAMARRTWTDRKINIGETPLGALTIFVSTLFALIIAGRTSAREIVTAPCKQLSSSSPPSGAFV